MLRPKETTCATVGNRKIVVADSRHGWSSSFETGRGDAKTHAVIEDWHVTKCSYTAQLFGDETSE
jgi:hypothetical protein